MKIFYKQMDGITYVRTEDLSMHGLAVCGKHDKCDKALGLAVALLRLKSAWRKRDFKLAAKIRTAPERAIVIPDGYMAAYLNTRIRREHLVHSARGQGRSAIDERCAKELVQAWEWRRAMAAYR